MREVEWVAGEGSPAEADETGGRQVGGGAGSLAAAARNLLIASTVLMVLYGVGIRLDVDVWQHTVVGPFILLRPWFFEVLAWGGFFWAWYRFWVCYRPHCRTVREWQALRFSRSDEAWELIAQSCICHNVFPESRQLSLAGIPGNQRQLEAMARIFLKVAGPLSGKVGFDERDDAIALHFPDLQLEYQSFDAARTHVQKLGAIDLLVDRAAFAGAVASARLRGGALCAEVVHCRLPLLVAFALLGLLLLRVLTLAIPPG